jgi:hypothetical protein
MKRGPRWYHYIKAHLGGYFWLACPNCGRMFGGHERLPPGRGPVLLRNRIGEGQGTCGNPECAKEVEARNESNFPNYSTQKL